MICTLKWLAYLGPLVTLQHGTTGGFTSHPTPHPSPLTPSPFALGETLHSQTFSIRGSEVIGEGYIQRASADPLVAFRSLREGGKREARLWQSWVTRTWGEVYWILPVTWSWLDRATWGTARRKGYILICTCRMVGS